MTLQVTHVYCTYRYKHTPHIYALQSETAAFVGRTQEKVQVAAFMQVIMLSLLSKYAGDPSPRVPALPACLHTYAPPPSVFGRKSTQAQREKNTDSLK